MEKNNFIKTFFINAGIILFIASLVLSSFSGLVFAETDTVKTLKTQKIESGVSIGKVNLNLPLASAMTVNVNDPDNPYVMIADGNALKVVYKNNTVFEDKNIFRSFLSMAVCGSDIYVLDTAGYRLLTFSLDSSGAVQNLNEISLDFMAYDIFSAEGRICLLTSKGVCEYEDAEQFTEILNYNFDLPQKLAFIGSDYYIFADNVIYTYNTENAVLTKTAKNLLNLGAVEVDENYLYIADNSYYQNKGLIVFRRSNLELICSYGLSSYSVSPLSGQLFKIEDISIYNGNLIITDSFAKNVQSFYMNNRNLLTVGSFSLFSFGGNEGMLNNPQSAAAYDGTVYIADTFNNRLQTWSVSSGNVKISVKNTVAGEDITAPENICANGETVFSIDENKIALIDSEGNEFVYSHVLNNTSDVFGDIIDLKITFEGDVYAADSKNRILVKRAGSEGFTVLCQVNSPKAIAVGYYAATIYVLTSDGVNIYDNSGSLLSAYDSENRVKELSFKFSKLMENSVNITDIDVDFYGNIYLLNGSHKNSENKIITAVYKAERINYEYVLVDSFETSLSVTSVNFDENYDLYLTSSMESSVYKVLRDDIGAMNYDSSTQIDPPELKCVIPAVVDVNYAIVYPRPGSAEGPVIHEGTSVLILSDNIENYPEYNFIYYNGKTGYVRKSAVVSGSPVNNLKEIPEKTLDFDKAVVLFGNDGNTVKMLKYPSAEESAPFVCYLPKQTVVKIVSDVADYNDNGVYFYKIEYDGTIGYVARYNVTPYSSSTENVEWKPDAKVNTGSDDSVVYIYYNKDDTTSAIYPALKNGDRVRLVEKFSRKNEWTLVEINNNGVLVQGYIKTSYLITDSQNTTELVLGISIPTVGLAAGSIVLIAKKRKSSAVS